MVETTTIENPTQTQQAADVTAQLRDAIHEVFLKRRNAKAHKQFLQALEGISIAKCTTKVGWVSGKAISFDCIIKKGGNGDLWNEIAKGVEKKVEMLNFIYGLNPNEIEFDPEFVVDEFAANHFFTGFKLVRHEKK